MGTMLLGYIIGILNKPFLEKNQTIIDNMSIFLIENCILMYTRININDRTRNRRRSIFMG